MLLDKDDLKRRIWRFVDSVGAATFNDIIDNCAGVWDTKEGRYQVGECATLDVVFEMQKEGALTIRRADAFRKVPERVTANRNWARPLF